MHCPEQNFGTSDIGLGSHMPIPHRDTLSRCPVSPKVTHSQIN
jgi:hypothetical protein